MPWLIPWLARNLAQLNYSVSSTWLASSLEARPTSFYTASLHLFSQRLPEFIYLLVYICPLGPSLRNSVSQVSASLFILSWVQRSLCPSLGLSLEFSLSCSHLASFILYYPESSLFLPMSHLLSPASTHWPLPFLIDRGSARVLFCIWWLCRFFIFFFLKRENHGLERWLTIQSIYCSLAEDLKFSAQHPLWVAHNHL